MVTSEKTTCADDSHHQPPPPRRSDGIGFPQRVDDLGLGLARYRALSAKAALVMERTKRDVAGRLVSISMSVLLEFVMIAAPLGETSPSCR